MLKLYNTLTRKKEGFKPIEKGKVGMYSCGPTVYWYQHIGNMRTYVFSDVLRRVLTYNGFEVNHIINVTDVGHLTSDSDIGEDKMESAAAKEGKTAKEISHFYFDEFLEDFKKLNLAEPNKWVWATEHIEEQIDLIKKLEEKGYVYKTNDGMYFDTGKFKNYGKFSRKKIEDLHGGKRIELRDKKNITDFVLWKFSEEPGKRQQEWDSPWGIGFPGWHIECSAMSSKYLGEHFDIHTGGEDHVTIHHENEIAQSECAFGKHPWVNFWMHGAFLNFKGGKMSKSSGDIKTISEIEKDGISPMAYRYFTYTAHYRKPLTLSGDALSAAVNSYKKLKNITTSLEDDSKTNKEYLKKFEERINDDLDMPGAIAVLWGLLRDGKAVGKLRAVKKMDEVFGLKLLGKDEERIIKISKKAAKDIDTVINLTGGDKTASYAIVQRVEARESKDWKKSDDLRNKLKDMGWIIKDSKDDYNLEKK